MCPQPLLCALDVKIIGENDVIQIECHVQGAPLVWRNKSSHTSLDAEIRNHFSATLQTRPDYTV